MALRIDWKRSLFFTAVIFIILWGIGFYIEDQKTYFFVAIALFIVIFIAANLVSRRR